MSLPKEENDNQNIHGYLLIALYVLLLYLVTIPFYIYFNETSLPRGDAFTYTVGWFVKLDAVREDYFAAFRLCFSSNFYWLMNLMIFLLSPFLVKEPFSIALVNFVMWGVATGTVYRLVRHLRFSEGFSFIIAWFVWLYPINYGFLTHESVPVLGLDAMFMAALTIFTFNLLYFVIEPEKTWNAVMAGISTGLALWARGFSLAVVLMIAFCPMIFLVLKNYREKNTRVTFNIYMFLGVGTSMAGFYYFIVGQAILHYYAAYSFVADYHWKLHDAMQWIKNVPGFFFWRYEDSLTTITITIVSHFLVLFAVGLTFFRAKNLPDEYRTPLQLISFTAAFIYWATYFINIALWSSPHFNIYNCLLQYSPMRIAMTLSLFIISAYFVLTRGISIKRWVIAPTIAFAVLYGGIATKVQTPEPIPGIPSPQEIESFSKDIDGLSGGGKVSMLWLRHYNPAILKYYRIKNNLPFIKFYAGKNDDRFWYPNPTEEDHAKIKEDLRGHFDEANINIVPEFIDQLGGPYVVYHFRDEIANVLNSPESPRFVVRMILSEYGGARLLVLQKEKDANGQGELLRYPYGYRSNIPVADYGSNVIRYHVNTTRCSNVTLDTESFYERPHRRSFSFGSKASFYPHPIIRKCNTPISAKKYSIGSGPTAEEAARIRMPTAWKLQGSNNKTKWDDLDTQEGQTQWQTDETRTFNIAKPETYKYYRLLVTAGGVIDVVRLYKFDLLTD